MKEAEDVKLPERVERSLKFLWDNDVHSKLSFL